MSEQSTAHELSAFQQAIHQYVEAVDASDEKLADVYRTANAFYSAGKLSEAYHTLLVYFMLDQETHLRDIQMHAALTQMYGRAINYCKMSSDPDNRFEESKLARELGAAYLDVSNRVSRISNSEAHDLLNRIDADLRVIEARNPHIAKQREEGIKERKEMVGAINELAKAGKLDIANDYIHALMEKAEALVEDTYTNLITLQDVIAELQDSKNLIALTELDVVSLAHQLTEAYNTSLITQHMLLPALKADTFILGQLEDPKYDQYSLRIAGLKQRLDDVCKLTEKGLIVEINTPEEKRFQLTLRVGQKNVSSSAIYLHELLQGTEQLEKTDKKAAFTFKVNAWDYINLGTAINERSTVTRYNTKNGMSQIARDREGGYIELGAHAGAIGLEAKITGVDLHRDELKLPYHAQTISKSGKLEGKEVLKDALKQGAEFVIDEAFKAIQGEEPTQIDMKKANTIFKIESGLTLTDREREAATKILGFDAKFTELTPPEVIKKLFIENVKTVVEACAERPEIDPMQRIIQSVVNFEHAQLEDLMETIRPELQKLDHISPWVVLSEISHIVDLDEISQYQLRGRDLMQPQWHDAWSQFVEDNHQDIYARHTIAMALDIAEDTQGQTTQEIMAYLHDGWGSDGIDVASALELARDNLHIANLAEALEKLEQFRADIGDPCAYPKGEEIQALFNEGQAQDDQEITQSIA